MPAPVTHFEINLKDARKGKAFYETLFGWRVTTMPELNYGLVDTGVRMGINGGIGEIPPHDRPNVVFYIQVEDLEGTLRRVIAHGGQVVLPVTEVAGIASFAQFSDPEGNVVGLLEGPQGPPLQPDQTFRSRAVKASGKKKVARKDASRGRKGSAKKR
jgi:uncharacterized protein